MEAAAARWLRGCIVVLGFVAAWPASRRRRRPAVTTRPRRCARATRRCKDRLTDNAFRRPLVLESTQEAGDLKGDIYAVVEHPYATVRTALSRPRTGATS